MRRGGGACRSRAAVRVRVRVRDTDTHTHTPTTTPSPRAAAAGSSPPLRLSPAGSCPAPRCAPAGQEPPRTRSPGRAGSRRTPPPTAPPRSAASPPAPGSGPLAPTSPRSPLPRWVLQPQLGPQAAEGAHPGRAEEPLPVGCHPPSLPNPWQSQAGRHGWKLRAGNGLVRGPSTATPHNSLPCGEERHQGSPLDIHVPC